MTLGDGESGTHAPLGASWDGSATTFRLFSAHATAIDLVLDGAPARQLPMERGTNHTWHLRTELATPGSRYGFRAHGPWKPDSGHLFNSSKLLLDPYARAIDGPVRWHESLRIARHGGARGPISPDASDSAAHLPRSVVVADDFDWRGDRHPRRPWSESLIYECHVKGMTALHPMVPPELRGTWLGLASAPVLEHFTDLGVTAIELLPVQPAADSAQLVRSGLTNYWGYATVGFFTPDRRFASVPGHERHEFREMVRRFHAAGIEVVLDVVYNHTGEGGIDGPTTSFRGLDNAAYYRLRHDGLGMYEDFTGCGHTLDVRHDAVRRLVLDSLRFWVGEMHVDGFRFDLAPVLGRGALAFDANATLLADIAADPVLRASKLIAEPWDLGPGGYQLGRFPPPFAEWNGRYRDTVRRFWRGVGGVSDLATRLSGSSDFFADARSPQASINFVACHDGFTLRDLVSYARKHNLANGERNHDGSDWNESRNWGVEGPTADPVVLERRERAMRSMMATLALSLGVPMLNQGDEMGRTQQGNNNPWNQDSALSWLSWLPSHGSHRMHAFTRRVFELRRRYRIFQRAEFLPHHESEGAVAHWLDASGQVMTESQWHDDTLHLLAVRLSTARAGEEGVVPLFLVLNGSERPAEQALPEGEWTLRLDTSRPGSEGESAAGAIRVTGGALVLLEGDPTWRCPVP